MSRAPDRKSSRTSIRRTTPYVRPNSSAVATTPIRGVESDQAELRPTSRHSALRRQPLSGMDAKGGKQRWNSALIDGYPISCFPPSRWDRKALENAPLDIIPRRIWVSAATERPFRCISTNRRQGRFATPIQYRRNVCSSCRHASLKSRSGSTCLSIQSCRISSIVMFGARYVSTMMRHTVSAASTTCGDETRRIWFVSA